MFEITRRRLARGWSQNELARRARMAPSELSKIEHGRLVPYTSQLKKLARALGVPLNEADCLVKEAANTSYPNSQTKGEVNV